MYINKKTLLSACLSLFMLPISAAELHVGVGQKYTVPSAAAAAAQNGDTVIIHPGVYKGDVCRWRVNNLTIRGAGAEKVLLDAAGKICEDKAIWIIAGDTVTISGITFSGAACPDKNGAGIRAECRKLNVRACVFRNNENGILSGARPDGEMLIEDCEFADNGANDGYSHNLYIGRIRRLTFRGNYSHHARQGHTLKSRAEENLIYGNRFADGADGQSSYLIDLPNGGRGRILGNFLQQGRQASNAVLIAYGREKTETSGQDIEIVGNLLLNDRPRGVFVSVGQHCGRALITNNTFAGAGDILEGTAKQPIVRDNIKLPGGVAELENIRALPVKKSR